MRPPIQGEAKGMIQKIWLRLLMFLMFCVAFVAVTPTLMATSVYDEQCPSSMAQESYACDAAYDSEGIEMQPARENRVNLSGPNALLAAFSKFYAANSELNILGKGSTADLAKGTSLPRNLREQLAIEQAAASPTAGTELPINMTDPRWPGTQGWEKWQQVIKPGGDPITVHYLYSPVTKQIDDFKIVLPGVR
jgi:hypothetical protein